MWFASGRSPTVDTLSVRRAERGKKKPYQSAGLPTGGCGGGRCYIEKRAAPPSPPAFPPVGIEFKINPHVRAFMLNCKHANNWFTEQSCRIKTQGWRLLKAKQRAEKPAYMFICNTRTRAHTLINCVLHSLWGSPPLICLCVFFCILCLFNFFAGMHQREGVIYGWSRDRFSPRLVHTKGWKCCGWLLFLPSHPPLCKNVETKPNNPPVVFSFLRLQPQDSFINRMNTFNPQLLLVVCPD